MEIKCQQCGNSQNISTPQFLSALDYDQLKHCKELAEAMIQQKKAESKVLIWSVVNEGICEKHFIGDDYLKAIEFMAEFAKKSFENGDPREIELVSRKIFQSQLKEFLEMKL